MLRVFRKIREKVLTESRLSTYLLYALGEILLVVIGILIALQVNTWNEERKFRAQQSGLLRDLAADLEDNLKDLERGRKMNALYLSEYRALAQAIREDMPSSPRIDSLCSHLSFWHSPFFTRTAYESLKNKGLEIIANDGLKKQIVSLFERDFVYLSEDYDRAEWDFSGSIKTELLNRHIQFRDTLNIADPTSGEVWAYPVDFEKVKADQRFINMLSELILLRSRGVYRYTETINRIEGVLAGIEDEIRLLPS